jgi:hypothetical protein
MLEMLFTVVVSVVDVGDVKKSRRPEKQRKEEVVENRVL